MDDPEREQAPELAKAREALDRGRLKRAVRLVWDAAHVAVRRNDERSLREVIDLATVIRDRASGHAQEDAQMVITYCSHCLADARAGVRRSSPLASLFKRERNQAVKTCPDCAETIKAAARICRFCGHRFDEQSDSRRQ